MKITQHGANLTKLTQLGMFNSYLVREADGLTLIDSGMGGAGKAIAAAAESLGAPIVRLALTHAHADHIGSLAELHAALPDAVVAVGEREARFMAGDFSIDADEPQAKLRGGYAASPVQPTRLLRDGDTLGSLRVVAAPGHTPGQIAFFDPRDGTLIAGDALQTAGGLAVAGVLRIFFPFPALATWHGPTALATAERLRALRPARLAVGHGAVIEQPEAMLDNAIAVARRKFGAEQAYGA
ncbi:MAG TPA: MBL fold metallo-hydrolase [Roseiflexaceae bacterium]|nr:MBL fold metallo-hydrolase [Roseiflexaceae bacterium]